MEIEVYIICNINYPCKITVILYKKFRNVNAQIYLINIAYILGDSLIIR